MSDVTVNVTTDPIQVTVGSQDLTHRADPDAHSGTFLPGTEIGTVTVGGAGAATIDFQSIPATYSHLVVVVAARSAKSATAEALRLRLNADSGANYEYERLSLSDTTLTAARATGQTSIRVGVIAADTAGAGDAGQTVVWIPNYANTNWRKAAMGDSIRATNSVLRDIDGGFWDSTAAINRVTLFPEANNFLENSTAQLLGVG